MNRADPSSEQQALATQHDLGLAIQHHTAGELSKAEGLYQRILETDPNQPVALHLLGVIAYQGGRNDTALSLISKALTILADSPLPDNTTKISPDIPFVRSCCENISS